MAPQTSPTLRRRSAPTPGRNVLPAGALARDALERFPHGIPEEVRLSPVYEQALLRDLDLALANPELLVEKPN